MEFYYKQVQLLNMRITKANLGATPTSESHERETEQPQRFYSMCFASVCMIWLAVGRIPVSAVLGTLMPALLQSPVWQGWRAAESCWLCTMEINHGRRGRAQEMGWAENPQEGYMPMFCNPGKKQGTCLHQKGVQKQTPQLPLSSLCHARTTTEQEAWNLLSVKLIWRKRSALSKYTAYRSGKFLS